MTKTEELLKLMKEEYKLSWSEKKQKFYKDGKIITRRRN